MRGGGYIDFFEPAKPAKLPDWYGERYEAPSLGDMLGAVERLGSMQAERERRQQLIERAEVELERAKAKESMRGEIAGILQKYGGAVDNAANELRSVFVEHGDLDKVLRFDSAMRTRRNSGSGGGRSGGGSYLIGPNGQTFKYSSKDPESLAKADTLFRSGQWRKPFGKTGGQDSVMSMLGGLSAESPDAGAEAPEGGFWDQVKGWLPDASTADNVLQNVGVGALVDMANAGAGALEYAGSLPEKVPGWEYATQLPMVGPVASLLSQIGPSISQFGKETRDTGRQIEEQLPQLEGLPAMTAGAGRTLLPMLIDPKKAALTFGGMVFGDKAGDFTEQGLDPASAGLGASAEALLMTALANPAVKSWTQAGTPALKRVIEGVLTGGKMGAGLEVGNPLIEAGVGAESIPEVMDWLSRITEGAEHGAFTGGVAGGIGALTNGFGAGARQRQEAADLQRQMEQMSQGETRAAAELIPREGPPPPPPGAAGMAELLPAPEPRLGLPPPAWARNGVIYPEPPPARLQIGNVIVPDAPPARLALPAPDPFAITIPSVVQDLLPTPSGRQIEMKRYANQDLPAIKAEAPAVVEKPVNIPEKAPVREVEMMAAREDLAPEIGELFAKERKPAEAKKIEEPTREQLEELSKSIETLEAEGIPVEEIPLSKIRIDNELIPNMKQDANAKGIIEGGELKGEKYWRVPARPIAVWERVGYENDLPVGTGRHRFDLATRLGEKTIPAQRLKESEGWTREKVMILDAESNILDNQGKVRDYAVYFRLSKLPEAEATGRGLLDRDKGRLGYNIGRHASDQTYYLHQIGKLTDRQAATISKLAPNDPVVQAEGVKLALKKATDERLYNYLASKMRGPKTEIEGEQGVLKWAQSDYEKYAPIARSRIAERMQDKYAAKVGLIKGAKTIEKSKSEAIEEEISVDIKNPAALARQRQYAKLADAWKRWGDLPELRSEVEKQVSAEIKKIKAEEASTGKDAQVSWFDHLTGEKGESGMFRPGEPFEGVRKLARAVKDSVLGERLPTQEEVNALPGTGEILRVNTPDSQRYFQGKLKAKLTSQTGYNIGIKIPGAEKIVAGYRDLFAMPETIVTKFPAARPVKDAADAYIKNVHATTADLIDDLIPFLSLKDSSRVGEFLQQQRVLKRKGQPVEETPENLAKLGFSPQEVEAIFGVRTTMVKSLGILRSAMEADPPAWAKESDQANARYMGHVAELIDQMADDLYVPFFRRGEWFVFSPDANGGEGHFSLHPKKKGINATIAELKKQGATADFGEMLKRPRDEAYGYLPADLMLSMGGLDGRAAETGAAASKTKNQDIYGFRKHLVKAKLTPGQGANVREALTDYVHGLSVYYGEKVAKGQFADAIGRLEGEPALKKWAEGYRGRVLQPDEKFKALRKYIATWYLTRPLSAALNLTQNITSTLPEMVNQLGFIGGGAAYGRGVREAGKYLLGKARPELTKAIEEAKRQGIVAHPQSDVLWNKQGVGKDWTDYAMILFSTAEELNRLHAFTTGFEVGRAKKLSYEQSFKLGEQAVNKTQYQYDVTNRPKIATSYGALPATFKLFSSNFVRSLRNKLGGAETTAWGTKTHPWKGLVTQLGIMGGLGGAAAFPLVGNMIKELEASGEDPKRHARKWLSEMFSPKTTNAILYGLPTLAGWNVSGAVAVSELAPVTEGNPIAAVGRAALGIVADPIQRVGRAGWLYGRGHKREAAEQVLPPLFRNIAEAQRWQEQGVIRSPATGQPVVDVGPDGVPQEINPTAAELLGRTMGFTPARLARAYERMHSADLAARAGRDNGNINHRLAWAIFNKDGAEAKAIIAEAKERGVQIQDAEVRRQLESMKTPGYAQLARAPKKARAEIAEILKTR